MIKNSDLFYQKTKEYQDKRNQLESQYNEDLKNLKQYEGSLYHTEQSQKLQKEYEEQLDSLRLDTTRVINVIIDGMKSNIGRTPAKAPTTEQTNLLNVLKLRNKVTKEDLDSVAEALKDCPIALSTLSEIALEKGFMGYNRYISDMGRERALKICEDNQIKDFLKYNTARASRVAAGHYFMDKKNLKRRRPFNTKEECFRSLLGIDGEDMQKFCSIVDTEE